MKNETVAADIKAPQKTFAELQAEVAAEKTPQAVPITAAAESTPTPVPVKQQPVRSVGAVACPTCGNTIFETSKRVELSGKLLAFTPGSKPRVLAENGAWCNVNCFGAYFSRV